MFVVTCGLYLVGGSFGRLTRSQTNSGSWGTGGLAPSVAFAFTTLAFPAVRFARVAYDAARTLDQFSGRLREQIDLDALTGEVLTAVTSTVQPSHASLWLRPPR